MVDPITSQSQFVSHQALSKGLINLLQNGPQQGSVQSQHPNGKFTLLFQGKAFVLDLKGAPIQAGDKVIARLVNGRLVIEVQTRSSDPAATLQAPSPGRSLAAVLTQLGMNTPNMQMLAQALLQAGIPLDQTALKELANLLPQISIQQISTLSFLFSRGMPISPSVVALLTHIFGPKPPLSKTANSVMSKLRRLDNQLDELDESDDEGDAVMKASQRRRLREIHERMQQITPQAKPSSQSSPDQEETLEEQLKEALVSPEILFQQNATENIQSFSEAVIRLLALLLEMQPVFENTAYAGALASLLQDVKTLHETLVSQTIQNLPPLTTESIFPVFVQIPYLDNGEFRQFELRYKPRGKDKKAGQADFLLDLSKLGAVHISVHWEHPNLSVTITVTDPAVQAFIQAFQEELKKVLQEKGFQVQSIGVVVGEIPETLKPKGLEESPPVITGFDTRA